MRGEIHIPRKITVSYKYETLEGVQYVKHDFQGNYNVEYDSRLKIDGVIHPMEVWLKYIEPYCRWTKIYFNEKK